MGHCATPTRLALQSRARQLSIRYMGAALVLVTNATGCSSDASDQAGATLGDATQTWTSPSLGANAGAGAVTAGPATLSRGAQPTGATMSMGSAPGAAQLTTAAAGNGAAPTVQPPAAAAAGAPAPDTALGHAAESAMGMSHAEMSCLLTTSVDPRDEMLTNEPLVWESPTGGKDLLVPQLVLDWMGENEFESAHDGWHLVRKWDQSCLQSNASASTCRAAQRLQMQGLERAPIQQGGPGDGLAFMAMHRHMIHMLKQTFPKHAELFDGFEKVPRSTEDSENPVDGHRISWTSDNIKGFDILENVEQHLDQFPTEDDLGNYIENTYRWTPETPMQPTNQPGSGLHGALHSQWAVPGSPGNLIEQAVDVRNYSFWKLHGWIDNVWQKYRDAKGLTDTDPDYVKIMHEQCMEMYYLKKSNRDLPMVPTGTTSGASSMANAGSAESGYFAKEVRPFLDTTCGGCHSAIGPSAGVTLGGAGVSSAEVIQGLVGAKASNGEYSLIEPGSPERSWVYLKASGGSESVSCKSACGRQKMPPSGGGLTADQLQHLHQWITDGATTQ